jgi:hypothetical protein
LPVRGDEAGSKERLGAAACPVIWRPLNVRARFREALLRLRRCGCAARRPELGLPPCCLLALGAEERFSGSPAPAQLGGAISTPFGFQVFLSLKQVICMVFLSFHQKQQLRIRSAPGDEAYCTNVMVLYVVRAC